MEIFNDLKLRFEQQIWEKSPELAVIDSIIVSNKELVDIIKDDVRKKLKNNKLGRKDNPTVEQILRLAIYKEIKKLKMTIRNVSQKSIMFVRKNIEPI